MSASQPTSHIVLAGPESWGHVKSLCPLTFRLLQSRLIYITFLISPDYVERIEAELDRYFGSEYQTLRSLVRVVGVPMAKDDKDPSAKFTGYLAAFPQTYEDIVNEVPLTCAHTGKQFSPVVAPDVIIMDCFCVPALEAAHKLSKKPVKILAWVTHQASFLLYPFAPAHRGGRGDYRPRIMSEVARTQRPFAEVAEEIYSATTGAVVRVPGLPPMYDYELAPQPLPVKGVAGLVLTMMQSFFDQCDGMVLATAEAYEPEAIAEIRAWFAETSREIYTLGPLFPVEQKAVEGVQNQSEQDLEITQFLQSTLDACGPKSLLYISYGSNFWPSQPEKIWTLLDVVIEKRIPFIMSQASPLAVVPNEVVQKVNEYKHGLLCKWAPQQTILAHPVTGWFLTHAGQNSVMEAILDGVPMICWPFLGDQPTNSARLSESLDVAYELLEGRSEPNGLKPLHRLGKAPTGTIDAMRREAREVLDKAFGEDGARKRHNMAKLQEVVLNAWNDDGPARRDMARLLAALQL